MDWLNYHHLYYFWVVAREGSITRGGEVLNLTQPTISAQIAALEKHFGTPLFRRTGRAVTLTETGRLVFDYADDIFRLGAELTRVMQAGPVQGRAARVVIGVADVVPKMIVHRLLAPLADEADPVQLVCVEDKADRLLAELALHHVDMIVTDFEQTPPAKVKAYHHLLGECGVTWLAAPQLAAKLRKDFPASLDGAPVLLPLPGTALRRSLDLWLAARRLRPLVRGEFADSALVKVFGQHGTGAFAVPSAIQAEVVRQYGVQVLGRADGLKERYFAVTVDRKLRHPAVVRISETARSELFAEPAG